MLIWPDDIFAGPNIDCEWHLEVTDETGRSIFRLRLLAESMDQEKAPTASAPRPIGSQDEPFYRRLDLQVIGLACPLPKLRGRQRIPAGGPSLSRCSAHARCRRPCVFQVAGWRSTGCSFECIHGRTGVVPAQDYPHCPHPPTSAAWRRGARADRLTLGEKKKWKIGEMISIRSSTKP
jgi:hypothetical protein